MYAKHVIPQLVLNQVQGKVVIFHGIHQSAMKWTFIQFSEKPKSEFYLYSRYIKLSCGHSISSEDLMQQLHNCEMAEIPICTNCSSPISYISRQLDHFWTLLVAKKTAVSEVLNEYFALKSNVSEAKKKLIEMCKYFIKQTCLCHVC